MNKLERINEAITKAGAILYHNGIFWFEKFPTEEERETLKREIKEIEDSEDFRSHTDICFGSSDCTCPNCTEYVIPSNLNLGIAGIDY